MIKSWWAEKSTSEKQIVAALAVLSLGVFCWLGVIKPIDTYIAEHQSHAQKIKKDIKSIRDQAAPMVYSVILRLRSPSKISFSRKQNVRIWLSR